MTAKTATAPEGEMAAAKRAPTRWSADSATDGGPTSLDVLLGWLLTPGNYKRFHQLKKGKAVLDSQAVQDVIVALKCRGIHHRTDSSVKRKVSALENQFLAAKTWLKEKNIHNEDVVDGKVDKAELLAICPDYFKLLPVFDSAEFLNAKVPTQTSAANGGQVESADSSDGAEKHARSKLKRRAVKKVTESPRYPSKRRQTTEKGHLSAAGVVHRTTTYRKVQRKLYQRSDERSMVVRDLGVPLPPAFQRRVHEVKVQHAKKSSRAVLEHEVKLRTKMMECDVEFKRDREQVQLVLEKVLARQKMKGLGVTEQELDAILPLTRP